MAMTWTSLTADKDTEGSIKQWVNHARVPSETIVTEAEGLIFQSLRVLKMNVLATGSVLKDATSLDISGLRFLSPKIFRWYGERDGKVTFRKREMFEITLAFDDQATPELITGTPSDATHNRQTIFFNKKLDEDLRYRMWYYQKPLPLSASNDSNFLVEDYPHIMRSACLARAFAFRKDTMREDKELKKMIAFIEQAQIDSDMADETAEFNMYWNADGIGSPY